MDREKLDDWCEQGILWLVLAILVTGPLALGGAGIWQFLALQGLTLAALVLWGARIWLKPRGQFLCPPICLAVVAFVAYTIVRYLQSDVEYVSRQELIRILVYAAIFFIVLNNLRGQDSAQIVVLTMMILGVGITLYAMFQFATHSNKVWNLPGAYPGRGTGTYYNPDHLAGFLEMLLPLGFCYVLAGRQSHVTKVFLGYASLMMIAGVGVTLSRGGMLSCSIVLMLMCGILLFQRNYRIQAAALLVVLVAGAAVLVSHVNLIEWRFNKAFSGDRLGDLRLSIWQSALGMWRDHLWLGVGPGLFDQRFPLYRTVDDQMHPIWAHNDYLNTLAEYGIVGMALIAIALALLYVGVARTWKYVRVAPDDFSRKKSNKFAFLLGASLGLLAIYIHSALDFNMHLPANAILAVTLMALVSGQLRFATEQYWFSARIWVKCAATVLICAGLGYLGYQGWRAGTEEIRLEQARRTQGFSFARIAALERVRAIEPMNYDTAYSIAECYRGKSFEGNTNYVGFAKQAMDWYRQSMKLNPYYANNWLGYGMCLDWISPQPNGEDSAPYFQHANALDPNGAYVSAAIGQHYISTGDLAASRTWLRRSWDMEWHDNAIPREYLPIVDRRMEEDAAEAWELGKSR